MGNCCAAQKQTQGDDTKRPLRQNIMDKVKDNEMDTASVNTRASTPSGAAQDYDKDKQKKADMANLDQSPIMLGDRRANNLNQLEQLQSRDPSSNAHSQASSTIPGEISGLTINKTQLEIGQIQGGSKSRQENKDQKQVIDRRSMISGISEFKQDSADLDEKVADSRAENKSSRNMRSERNLQGSGGKREANLSAQKRASANQMGGVTHKLDLSIPQETRKQIYQITSDFPVQRPYSVNQDWQRVLERYQAQQQHMVNDQPAETAYDELAENLMALNNRNWIRDQLKMHMENRLAMQSDLSTLPKQKQALQLREHFTWLVWSVAQFYFGAPDRSQVQGTENDLDASTAMFHSRATIPDQDVSGFEDQEPSGYMNASRINNGNRLADNKKPGKLNLTTQQTMQRATTFTCKLPKTSSTKWSEGFSFKGVYFRLIPYEDASFVLEEIKALKYIQTELLDLQAQEQAFASQQTEMSMSGSENQMHSPFSDGNLHKDVVLPFLVGIKCCGFYLYGTPLIYTQDVGNERGQGSIRVSNDTNPFGGHSVINQENSDGDQNSLGFSLPRFSSVNAPAESNMNNLESRRKTFNYLHENIDEETMRDPILQRMPLLKNICKRNLIPVIDFEDFNKSSQANLMNIYSSGLSNNSVRPTSFKVNYLLVYLSSVLRTIAPESSTSVIFSVPSPANEDIQFHPYPQDRRIDYLELEKMLSQSQTQGPGNVSAKPLGDREEQKGALRLNLQKQTTAELQQSFGRKFMSKHGWNCYMIEKRSSNLSSDQENPLIMQNQQFSARGANENKRASTFFNLRENSAGGLEKLLENKNSSMSVIKESQEGNGTLPSGQKHHNLQQTPQSNPFRMARGGQENLESSPRIQMNITPGLHNTQTRASQQVFVSPQKKTVMKRSENPSSRDDLIYGNVVISAVFPRGFKVKFSLTQHNYTNGIDTMFQLSLEQVAKVMELSDRVTNIDTLKSLMHRKGLNLRFLWVLLTKVKLKHSRELIMAAILMRTMRKVVNEEVKIGSCIKKQITSSAIPSMQQLSSTQPASLFRRSSNQQQDSKSTNKNPSPFQQSGKQQASGSSQLPQSSNEPDHYQGNHKQLFRECLTLYANAVMKNKFAKYKQVFDESLLGLFLSRLKILTLSHSLELTATQLNYLESKDIIDHVLEMPSQNPIMFLNAMQIYFNLDFKKEFTRLYRQDKYFVLNKPQPVGRSDITAIKHAVETYWTLRDQAYFILARKISSNQRLRAQKRQQMQDQQNQMGVRDSQNLARMFQRPRKNHHDISQNYNDAEDTPRGNNKSASNQRMNSNFINNKSNRGPVNQVDTHRNFKNLQQSNVSIPSSSSNFQNIIDLSRSKRNTFKPKYQGEILLPTNFYKMHTSPTDSMDDSMHDLMKGNSVFQPYYELPNIDVINEWVIVLESLLNEVYSVQGCEAVRMEALTHQCLMTLLLEQDADSSFKVLAKIRELLHQAFSCPPEIIVMCMTLTGIFEDMNEEIDQFPIESEKNYIAAMIIAFQIYGDPRGRGNYSIPYYLFFAWKLSLLSLADGKKSNDNELSEELMDSALASLFNHKRMYKNSQLELVAAQEQAHGSGLTQNPSTGALNTFGNMNNSTFIRNGQLLQFEISMDQQDILNGQFDLKKYRRRPQNVVTAGGFVKTSQQLQVGMMSSAVKPSEANALRFSSQQKQPVGIAQSHSKREVLNATAAGSHQSMNHLQKSNFDADISDIDIELQMEDDEDRQRLIALNFKESETVIGKAPFQHWTINRQIIQSQQNMLDNENPKDARQMRKEMIRDQLTKQVDLESFFPWIVTYNPVQCPSGMIWDAKTIKEVVFCQNQQITGQSEPSSATFSSHKMSQYSYRSNSERNPNKRKAFLNPYSSYIGKEVGGIQKGEILGQLYSWGTDQFGQLGLEYFITNKQMGAMQSLKILHPRLLVPLKDELIKEICCGHAHTLAINQFGQMYSWGSNESGQLGLGLDNVPEIVRKPVLNTTISNVAKLAAGHEHSLALTKTSELYVWGTGILTGLDTEENVGVPTHLDFSQKAISKKPIMMPGSKIVQIACGGLHTAVLTHNGDLFTWGFTQGGQLGHKLDADALSVKVPMRVEYLAEKNLKISQAACGEAHTVVLTTEDQVWGWGLSNYGQLGLGFSADSFEPGEGNYKSKVMDPTEITQYMPPEITISKIICGAAFTLFLTTENELYGCGINDLGQLGLDTYLEEMQIAVIDRARAAAGGIRDVVTSDVTVPSRVICFEGLKVNSVSAGESHSLALIGEEKSLWAWGMFRNGQLGLGEVNQKMNPRPVQSLHTTNVHKMAAGQVHSLALLGDSNQLTAMAANFFLNSDILSNPWTIDYRRLGGPESTLNREQSIAQKPI